MRGAGFRLAVFIACAFAFPFLMKGLMAISDCTRIGGACFALAYAGAATGKPLIAYLFIFSFIGISIRRARDAGLPFWIGLCIPVLLIADLDSLFLLGGPWPKLFTQGLAGIGWPRFILQAFCFAIVLAILRPRAPAPGRMNPFGRAGQIAFALGIFIAFFNLLSALLSHWETYLWLLPIIKPLYLRPGWIAWPYAQAALLGLMLWIAWKDRNRPEDTDSGQSSALGDSIEMPNKKIAWVAAAVTICAYFAASRSEYPGYPSLMLLLANFASVAVPTFLIYAALIWTGVRWFKQSSYRSTAMLVLALVPFALWGYSRWSVSQADAREAAEIKAIPTTAVAAIPSVLVYDSDYDFAGPAAWSVPEIQRVVWKEALGSQFRQLDRPSGQKMTPFASKHFDGVPETYLLLKMGRKSQFADAKKQYAGADGPFELRLISPGHDDLVAVTYKTLNPSPSIPPVLTSNGWYRAANIAFTEKISANVSRFLANALIRKDL